MKTTRKAAIRKLNAANIGTAVIFGSLISLTAGNVRGSIWTDEQRALRAEWLHTCHWGAIRTAFDGFHTDDIHADLADLGKGEAPPARLVIAGGATVVLPEDADEIAALLPGIEIRRVDRAGHMIPWDDLDGFLAAVMDFGI